MNRSSTFMAGIIALGLATPAVAGGVTVSNGGLSDILVEKGVITKADAKKASKSNNGKLKFGMKLFLNTTRTDKQVTTAPAAETKTLTSGLNVDRAYFTAKYYYNDDWLVRLTFDAANQTPVAGLGKDQVVFVKYAYVQGKLIDKAAVLRLGQSHTPWIDYQQHQNKHRYVFKTFADEYKFDDSSDLGIGLKGKLANDMIGYWVTATNGTGYSKGNVQAGHNAIDFNSRISVFPIDNVSLDFQFRNGKRGTRTFSSNTNVAGVTSTLWQVQLAYASHDYGLGVGYLNNTDEAKDATSYTAKHGSSYTLAASNDQLDSDGIYVWGRAKLPIEHVGVFGTFEYLKNDPTGIAAKSAATDEKITRYVAGLEYSPLKNISFSAVADIQNFDNTLGVSGDKTDVLKYGLYSQVKF